MPKAIDQLRRDIFSGRLRLHVIDLQSIRNDFEIKTLNRVFSEWKVLWEEVFRDSNSLDSLNPNDLMRQNKLVTLFYNEELIGFNFITCFNMRIDIHKESSYVKGIQQFIELSKILQEHEKAYSIEYLTILPKWRRFYKAISLGEVLIRLSIFDVKKMGGSLLLGTTRQDIGVTKIAESAGFVNSQRSLLKCNYLCDIVTFQVSDKDQEISTEFTNCIEELYKISLNDQAVGKINKSA